MRKHPDDFYYIQFPEKGKKCLCHRKQEGTFALSIRRQIQNRLLHRNKRRLLVSFSASASSISFRVSSTLPRTNSLSWPLITSSFSCTIFSDMVYRLLSEWCVVTSFYQRSANHVSFYLFFNLRNLSYLILLYAFNPSNNGHWSILGASHAKA